MNAESTTKAKWILPPELYRHFQNFLTLYETVLKQAQNNRPLIIHGPAGVGKSLFTYAAESLYRRDHPEITEKQVKRVNVSALAKTIIESELFGHMKGAFTGAVTDKKGFVETSRLLILEEIGELPKYIQAKLLTLIEDGIYYPVGSTEVRHAKDIQIIATTNVEIGKKYFRQDFTDRCYLFRVPALYGRRGDILYSLAFHYPDFFRTLVPWQVLAVMTYHWPGNMRELEKFGMTGITDYSTEGRMNVQALIRGTTAYCQNDFFNDELFDKVDDTFREIGIDQPWFSNVLKKANLSLEYTFRYRDNTFSCRPAFGKLKLPAPVILQEFPDIAVLKPIKDFEDAKDFMRYLTEELLCVKFDANLNLLDIEAIYKDIEYYPPKSILIDANNTLLWDHKSFDRLSKMRDKADDYARNRRFDQFTKSRPSLLSEKDLLKTYYLDLLSKSDGNVAQAARLSGLKDKTFRSRLKKYDI